MNSSLDLIEAAKQRDPQLSERALAVRLGHSPTALKQARLRGNLSPGLALDLAEFLGAPEPRDWVALAGLETAPPSRRRDAMIRKIVANLRI